MNAAPGFLFIHPLIGVLAVGLVLATFATKAGQTKLQEAHYIAGFVVFTVMGTGIGLGLWAVPRYFTERGPDATLPSALSIHFPLAMLAAAAMLVQAVLGTLMLVNKRAIIRYLKIHRILSQVLVVIVLGVLVAGTLTVVGLVNSVLLKAVVILLGGGVLATGFILLVRQLRQTRLYNRGARRVSARTQSTRPAKYNGQVSINFQPDEITVQGDGQRTLLQISLESGINHTHVCGGNARCSTCRVAVLEGLENCLPRNSREQTLADHLHFDPSIRLACQTRLRGDVEVRRLVLDEHDIRITSQIQPDATLTNIGEEKELAVLFSDIRGFTSFAESRPPFDVVHALNRYYEQMGEAITRYGGTINNYMGDGFLALFEAETPARAAQNATLAGLEMLAAVEGLNPYYETAYDVRFDIGIGIHLGPVVIGSLGMPGQMRISAIGDTVNMASRIETANKGAGTQLLVSANTFQYVAHQARIGRQLTASFKGKSGQYLLYEITDLLPKPAI